MCLPLGNETGLGKNEAGGIAIFQYKPYKIVFEFLKLLLLC